MKNSIQNKLFVLLTFLILITLLSCEKPEPIQEVPSGKIQFSFQHFYNGEAIVYDTLMYENQAGNKLMINEIQYFISDVTLMHENGTEVKIKDWIDIYYIDKDIPSTLVWNVYDRIPIGGYNAIRFVFGISASKNIPYMFVNPPERDMFWPYYLGGEQGGYHYLKLNGKWLSEQDNQVKPFNFHLGVGQVYAGNEIVVDSIIGFVQNYFTVALQNCCMSVEENKTTMITLTMNVEEWFRNPHVFDFDDWGAYIMQNQQAMQIGSENGHTVFTISNISIQ
jgi:hypothetical protein